MIRTLALCALAALPFATAPAQANPYANKVEATVLPGWQNERGDHVTALRLVLAPGWKTYWRSPGDAGIPPEFDWRGSGNLEGVALHWPTPHVFTQNGMRSVGYKHGVTLPITVRPLEPDKPVELRGQIQIGICKDICVPVSLDVTSLLTDSGAKNPQIAAALADQPMEARKGGVKDVRCEVSATGNGLIVRAAVILPHAGGAEDAVMETSDPQVWVSEPVTRRTGDTLWIEAEMEHVSGRAFALNRSGVRLTVLGSTRAVDITGCPAK